MKSVFRNIITVVVLMCFLTSTTGMNLIEHYCSSKNKSFVFLYGQNPDCEDLDCCSMTDESSCCAPEHTTCCCENFNLFFKLDTDYFAKHHDKENVSCPIFIVEHLFNAENTCCSKCECHLSCHFSDDVGLPKNLLIKRTTELLL